MPDAGWYRDPQDSSVEEYWDGQNWSGQRRPSSGGVQTSAGLDDPTNVQPAYRQQARPTQDYSNAGYGRAAQQYAPQGQPYPAPPGYGSTPYQQPAATRRRRKLPWIIAAVVVLVVAAGLVTFLVRQHDAPSITYRGKPIAAADTVLTKAEKSVAALVTRMHGTKNGSTRCYYVQQAKPEQGARASDITDSLRCGPVLFVEGNRANEYLPVPLIARTSGTGDSSSDAHLTPDTSSLGSAELQAVPKSIKLVRPDGETPPSGNGGLSVPQPPPAQKNSIVATDLGSTPDPKSLSNSSMTAKHQKVRLLAAGRISHYGTGAAERSAPAGQELIAFQIEGGEGAVDGGGSAQPVLVVDGDTRQIPSAFDDEWDVAAVPTGSSPVVQLDADGYKQTLALPTGTAGAGNIAVLGRSHTLGLIGRDFDVNTTYRKGDASGTDRLSVDVTVANLYFWPPLYPGSHPSSASSAYLAIGVSYTHPGSSKVYGFAPGLLHLRLPDGSVLTPKNIASGPHVYDVFTVPASYTAGTLTIGGSAKLDDGSTQTLDKSKSFGINIRAH